MRPVKGKVVSLAAWRRRRAEQAWQTMIREALRDLAEFGSVAVTDLRLAEDVWQATWEMDELYVLEGDGKVWIVKKAIGSQMVGGE